MSISKINVSINGDDIGPGFVKVNDALDYLITGATFNSGTLSLNKFDGSSIQVNGIGVTNIGGQKTFQSATTISNVLTLNCNNKALSNFNVIDSNNFSIVITNLVDGDECIFTLKSINNSILTFPINTTLFYTTPIFGNNITLTNSSSTSLYYFTMKKIGNDLIVFVQQIKS